MDDLDHDVEPLSYRVSSTGAVRMWLREELRKVQRKGLDIEASKIALSIHGTRLDHLMGHEVEHCRSEALASLLARVPPTVRIIDVIAQGSLLWVGRRNIDEHLLSLLHRTFGACHIDPMAWSPPASWKDTIQKIFSTLSEDGSVAPGVDVLEAAFDSSGFSWSGSRKDPKFTEDLRHAVSRCGPESCRSIVLKVWKGGEGTLLTLDVDGLGKGEPPPSRGGLPAERVARRMDDLKNAAWKICELFS